MERQRYIDAAKGIGILLVVIGHASLKNQSVITYIYSFHMPLFFVITGMLLRITSASERDYKDIVKSRLRSIMLPYAIFSIIYSIIDFASHDVFRMINLKATICLQGSGPLWFLPTLFFSELIFIALVKYTKPKTSVLLSIFIGLLSLSIPKAILSFSSATFPMTDEYAVNLWLVLSRSLTCLLFLAAGYVFISVLSCIHSSVVSITTGLMLLIMNIFFCLYSSMISDSSFVGVDMHYMSLGKSNCIFLLCALLGSFGIILICKGFEKITDKSLFRTFDRLIRYWGSNSLLIMVTHLNCKILFIGNLFAMLVNPYISHAKDYIFQFNILWVTMLIETLLILLVNKSCPWLIGKKKAGCGSDVCI